MTGTWSSTSLRQQSHPEQTGGDLVSALRLLTTKREWSEPQPRTGWPFERRALALPPSSASDLSCAQHPHCSTTGGTNAQCRRHNFLDRTTLRAAFESRDERASHPLWAHGKSCIARSDMTVIRTSCPSLNYSFCPRRLPCGTAPCRGEVKPWCCLHPNGLPAHQASLKNRPLLAALGDRDVTERHPGPRLPI